MRRACSKANVIDCAHHPETEVLLGEPASDLAVLPVGTSPGVE
jgi:hypothetical protein